MIFYNHLKSICEEKGLKITPTVLNCGGTKGMIGKDIIKILENLNSNDEVRIVYNTAQPMWAKSIEIIFIIY